MSRDINIGVSKEAAAQMAAAATAAGDVEAVGQGGLSTPAVVVELLGVAALGVACGPAIVAPAQEPGDLGQNQGSQQETQGQQQGVPTEVAPSVIEGAFGPGTPIEQIEADQIYQGEEIRAAFEGQFAGTNGELVGWQFAVENGDGQVELKQSVFVQVRDGDGSGIFWVSRDDQGQFQFDQLFFQRSEGGNTWRLAYRYPDSTSGPFLRVVVQGPINATGDGWASNAQLQFFPVWNGTEMSLSVATPEPEMPEFIVVSSGHVSALALNTVEVTPIPPLVPEGANPAQWDETKETWVIPSQNGEIERIYDAEIGQWRFADPERQLAAELGVEEIKRIMVTNEQGEQVPLPFGVLEEETLKAYADGTLAMLLRNVRDTIGAFLGTDVWVISTVVPSDSNERFQPFTGTNDAGERFMHFPLPVELANNNGYLVLRVQVDRLGTTLAGFPGEDFSHCEMMFMASIDEVLADRSELENGGMGNLFRFPGPLDTSRFREGEQVVLLVSRTMFTNVTADPRCDTDDLGYTYTGASPQEKITALIAQNNPEQLSQPIYIGNLMFGITR